MNLLCLSQKGMVIKMGMAVKVRMLLAARGMSVTALAEKLGTSSQNLTQKLQRDNLTEHDLHKIAKACDATFEGVFTLHDTGKEI